MEGDRIAEDAFGFGAQILTVDVVPKDIGRVDDLGLTHVLVEDEEIVFPREADLPSPKVPKYKPWWQSSWVFQFDSSEMVKTTGCLRRKRPSRSATSKNMRLHRARWGDAGDDDDYVCSSANAILDNIGR